MAASTRRQQEKMGQAIECPAGFLKVNDLDPNFGPAEFRLNLDALSYTVTCTHDAGHGNR